MASDEMLQAINKHAMGDRAEFDELKERFKSMDDWLSSAAAALGYLIAKDELEAAKEEEEPDVYDEVVEVIKKYCRPPGPNSAHMAADELFTLIYKWLDDELRQRSYAATGPSRSEVRALFLPFVIKKAEA